MKVRERVDESKRGSGSRIGVGPTPILLHPLDPERLSDLAHLPPLSPPSSSQDKPPLPAFPKYEGLEFKSTALPITMPDVDFPPKEGLVSGYVLAETGKVPVPGTATFSVKSGMGAAVVDATA